MLHVTHHPGLTAFMSFLWIQSITITLILRNITLINLVSVWGCHFFAFLTILSSSAVHSLSFNSLSGYWIAIVSWADPHFWLVNLLVVACALLPIVVIDYYNYNYRCSLVDHIRFKARQAQQSKNRVYHAHAHGSSFSEGDPSAPMIKPSMDAKDDNDGIQLFRRTAKVHAQPATLHE
jgi:hypothetical protein